MKTTYFLALIVAAALLLPGSSSAAVHFGLPSAVKSTVKKLSAKVAAKKASYTLSSNSLVLSLQTNSYLVNTDTTTQTYYYSPLAAEVAALTPGKIIISTQGNGFLRKVDSVVFNGSQYEVRTTTATAEEAFEEADIAFTKQLLPADISPQGFYQARGVSIRPSSVSGEFTVVIASAVLFDLDTDTTTTYDQIIAIGTFKFTASVDGVLKIGVLGLQELKMQGTISETSDLKVKWETSVGLSLPDDIGSIKLAEYPFPPMSFGPVIVVPVVSVVVGAKGDINVSCTAEAGISQTASYTAGVWYRNGTWSPINEFSSNFTFTPPNFSYDVSASIKTYAGPKLNLKFWNIVGPSISVDGYFDASATGILSPPSITWSNYGGLEGVGGGEMTVFSLYKASYNINLFDYRVLIASGTLQPAIAAPDSLSAVAVSSSQINLTWQDNSNNEDGFKLERKTGTGGTYAQITTPNADAVNYSNTGLSAGTTYYYRIRAYNSGGNSAYSNETNTFTLPADTINNPPVIDSLTANPTSLSTGAATTVTCSASDADGDTLAYSWYAASGAISGTGYQVAWTAPASSSTYSIGCTVSDGMGGSVQRSTNVVVSIAINHTPIISSLIASPVSISTGAITTITCTASDVDADTLTYNWSAASGTISGSDAQITWTAPDTAAGYTITCSVTDGKGGSAQRSVNINVTNSGASTDHELPDTGQAACYNGSTAVIACPAPGNTLAQDGSYQPAAAQPSYTDNLDGTTTDNKTGLMWVNDGASAGCNNGGTLTWEAALNFCEGLTYAGYSDWRLPNVRELESIVDAGQFSPAINTAYFPNIHASYYWASTTLVSYTGSAWYVHFYDGVVGYTTKPNSYYVRCVRVVP